MFAEELFVVSDHVYQHIAVGQAPGGLDGVGQPPLALTGIDLEPVDIDGDVVLFLLVELDLVFEVEGLPVDARAHESLAAEFFELLAVLALAPAHDGRQQADLRAGFELHQPVDNLLHGLGLHLPPARVTEHVADARVEQAQVVVDLGHRADGRARVARGGLLLDGNRRREPLDGIDVGLAHLFEELARVGAQRLHVAPLPLGIDRIESQRALAAAREPGNHHQLVARNLQVDVAQVVLARAADDHPVGDAALCFSRSGGHGFRCSQPACCMGMASHAPTGGG